MIFRQRRLLALAGYVFVIILLGPFPAGPVVAANETTASGAVVLPLTPVPQSTPIRPVDDTNAPAWPLAAQQKLDLALVGATLIDGSGATPISDAVVTIRGNRIVAAGRAGSVSIPAGTPIRNLRGKTILPGIVNAHVHTDMLPTKALLAWTQTGVTTTRDLAGPPAMLLERRQRLINSKDATYPRLLLAGPFITVPGGHPIPRSGLGPNVVTVQGVADARVKVNQLLNAGVDLIKIVVSGRTDVSWPELSDAEIRMITETAHARGARVTAHVDRAVGLQRAVENGIDDAAHMPRDRMPDEVIALMVRRNVTLVPTIDVYEELAEGRGIGDDWRRYALPIMQDNLRRFVAAGGSLALGDDYGGDPGVDLGMPMAEMQHWIGAGLTPMQVLVAATQGSAKVSGMAGQIGMVRPGMFADLLVVNGDPLKDISALTRVALVMRDGKIIRQ